MTSPSKALTTPKGGLDTLCDRRQMEEYGCPKPRLDQQGSDAYLKLQFRYVARGEIGHLHSKQIVSALPEDGERPMKIKKSKLDSWDPLEEEESRPLPETRRQLERLHMVFRITLLMCIAQFPQFAQLQIRKEELDEWYEWLYGEDIGGRRPPPSEQVLGSAERKAWRKSHTMVYGGKTLSEALKDIKQDFLFWQRKSMSEWPGPLPPKEARAVGESNRLSGPSRGPHKPSLHILPARRPRARPKARTRARPRPRPRTSRPRVGQRIGRPWTPSNASTAEPTT